MRSNIKKGFTLLEILLVVAIIAILAGIVIVAINPAKQLGDARNAQRKSDVQAILNAVYQYSIDNNGTLPPMDTLAINYTNASTTCNGTSGVLSAVTREVCKTTGTDCSTGNHNGGSAVDLSKYLASTTPPLYLSAMPIDPSATTTGQASGYYIAKSANNLVVVCSGLTENLTSNYGPIGIAR